MSKTTILEPLERRRVLVNKMSEQHQATLQAEKSLRNSIERYRAFDPEVERRNIKRIEATTENLPRKIADQEVNKSKLEGSLKGAQRGQINPIFFWKIFSEEQIQLRKDVRALREGLSLLNKSLHGDNDALSKARVSIMAAQQRLIDHEIFNIGEAEAKLSAMELETRRIEHDLSLLQHDLENIEKKLNPHIGELDRLKSELAKLNEDLAEANRFDQRLSSARNKEERWLIHKECENRFGTGKLKDVFNNCRSKIGSLENNIPKLERRIKDELKKLERTIGHLLIDGNNVCYEGRSFIGLRAISALLSELGGRYKTTVVFDATIREKMKTDTQGIERQLGLSVKTHVAPTKTAADEYLVKLAEEDSNSFILSNDRYAEYHDYDVVKSGRVFRFLIADGKMMANDIDISVSF